MVFLVFMDRRYKASNREVIRAPLDGTLIRTAAGIPGNRAYQMCRYCIMDTTDLGIRFLSNGSCNRCTAARLEFERIALRRDDRHDRLSAIAARIRGRGFDREHDCLLALSGGFDSSLLLLTAVQLGLRPLVIHIDTGWNSELAVSNVYNLCKGLGLELRTRVINWRQMRALQASFLRSGLANLDAPQDHVIFASLYEAADELAIPTVLVGTNYATESILPPQWGYLAMDGRFLRDVHSRYDGSSLEELPIVSLTTDLVKRKFNRRFSVIQLLNFCDFNPETAVQELSSYGWRQYSNKHGESQWTSYFQNQLLPYRFGFDKRKAHLSSLIVSRLIDRREALRRLRQPLATELDRQATRGFIARKLELSLSDLSIAEERELAWEFDFRNRAVQWKALQTSWSGVKWARAKLSPMVGNLTEGD